MSEINYKAEVLKVWPDAAKQLHGTLCYIQNGMDGDALGFHCTHSRMLGKTL